MKRTKTTLMVLTTILTTLFMTAENNPSLSNKVYATFESDYIPTQKLILQKLVEDTFINGALNKLNVEEMPRGFHSDFAILIPNNNNLVRLSLEDWMQIIKQYRSSAEMVNSGIRNLEYTIEVLDITGDTAIIKTAFFRERKLIITDYLSYIKYPDGWKAVAKISHEHIINPLHLNL